MSPWTCSARPPETRRLLEAAMTEVAALAAAHGVTLAADIVSRTLEFLDRRPVRRHGVVCSEISWRARPSELDTQTGTIVRLGRKRGVDTPVNTFLYDCLAPGERLARAGS